MAREKLIELTGAEVINGISNEEFTVEEYLNKILERIEEVEPKIHAFITINKEDALKSAQTIDKKIDDGEKTGNLAGIVVGIKDNICTRNLRTTCGSKMLSNYYPPYDSTVVERLRKDGAIIIGKLNLDEFGMGSTTEFSKFGVTHNPWNLDYVPGGSSGGSGASVSSCECTVSLGSDTGGSIRCPASFCSVIGLKPTYGCVSRYGLISYANSLEQIGPIGRSVRDIVLLMNTISGIDTNDNTSQYFNPIILNKKIGKLKIAIIKDLINGSDPKVTTSVYSAIDVYTGSGWTVDEIALDTIKYALPSYYTLAMAEASSNLARYDNLRYGFEQKATEYDWTNYINNIRNNFGDEVKRRILIGSYVLSSGYYNKYYLKARNLKSLLKRELLSIFKKYDLIVGPTMPILPPRLGEKIDDPLKMYLMDNDTVVANLAGIPAMSIPCGFSDGLPIGLQLMAAPFNEQKLVDSAFLFENYTSPKMRSDL